MLRPLQHAGCRLAHSRTAVARAQRYITTSGRVHTVAQLLGANASAQSTTHDEAVTLNGFVRSVRKQKRVAFAAIGDGSSLNAVQAVLTPAQAGQLSTGAALRISGKWQPSPSGKEQSHELVASDVQVLGDNDAEVWVEPWTSLCCSIVLIYGRHIRFRRNIIPQTFYARCLTSDHAYL